MIAKGWSNDRACAPLLRVGLYSMLNLIFATSYLNSEIKSMLMGDTLLDRQCFTVLYNVHYRQIMSWFRILNVAYLPLQPSFPNKCTRFNCSLPYEFFELWGIQIYTLQMNKTLLKQLSTYAHCLDRYLDLEICYNDAKTASGATTSCDYKESTPINHL